MFINSIEPKQQKFHQGKLNSFLSLLNIYHGIHLSPEEKNKALFIVAEDERRGVYGGAILYQQRTFSSRSLRSDEVYETKIEKLLAATQSKKKVPWAVKLCLCLENDSSLSTLEKEGLYQIFFKTLHTFFMEFAHKKKIRFLTVTMPLVHTQRAFVDKNWPFLLEVQLPYYDDGFFHGILPLSDIKESAASLQTYGEEQ